METNLFEEEFIVEGNAKIDKDNNILRVQAIENFVLWFNHDFKNIKKISFEFCPKTDEGLAMIFFGANGIEGVDLFDDKLCSRTGEYKQYHSSDIKCFHASYYRRKWDSEREFHLANLRKSPGFNLIGQGPDPIPTVNSTNEKYYLIEIEVTKYCISFIVEGIQLYEVPIEKMICGYIGLRQMSPLVAEYKNLKVLYA